MLEAFADRFARSAQARGGRAMRLTAEEFLPSGGAASPDEKESFLEAIESLENLGIVKPKWKRYRRGEELNSATLTDPAAAFSLLGRPGPDAIVSRARDAALHEASRLRGLALSEGRAMDSAGFMEWLADAVVPEDAVQGLDEAFVMDLAKLLSTDERMVACTAIRALSIRLFADSKRIEGMLPLARRLGERARRSGLTCPDFSALERSWPEAAIAGDIVLHFRDGDSWKLGGAIIGLPLSTVNRIESIESPYSRNTALSIENKESFHMLSSRPNGFGCHVYAAGHISEATRRLIGILVHSGFEISHFGDLDPDGLLILEEVKLAAHGSVRPWHMDLSTFMRYQSWGRKLEPQIVLRLSRLSPETISSPVLGPLVKAIRESSVGVEQEIIDCFS